MGLDEVTSFAMDGLDKFYKMMIAHAKRGGSCARTV